jgi:elongation factor Ts
MMINDLKLLRKESGASLSACVCALENADGDFQIARKLLGIKDDENLPDIPSGIVESYIHHNYHVGVMIEVHCETMPTALSLSKFAKDLCVQIAATNPEFVSERDVPQERLVSERAGYAEKCACSGKDKKTTSKLIKSRMKRFYAEHCLMNQKYVQDTRITIRDLINNKIRETGEKIKVIRFMRFQVGK